jgi:hypothetical protein
MRSLIADRSGFLLNFIFLISFSFSIIPPQQHNSVDEPIDVAKITKTAAAYCQKLEHTILYFVCLEEITERINFAKDIALLNQGRKPRESWMRTKIPRQRIKNFYVYDFQFIRRNNQIRETRILLKENGKKKHEKNAALKTLSFSFKNIVLGPIGILSQHWQPYYDYKIIGEDEVNGLPAVILDASPKPGYTMDFLFGKVWFNKNNLDILKIEWSPQKIGNYAIFESRGLKYKSEPRITLSSEFHVEKNGIRFPSQFFIEEAYINKRGRKFVRSETMVTYKDFKFFTVEVEVK